MRVAFYRDVIYNGLGLIYTLNYTDVRVVGSIEEYASQLRAYVRLI